MTATIAEPKKLANLINGQWKTSGSSRLSETFNPSTGKVLAHLPLSSAAEANAAVDAAAEALPKWSETPAIERARVMFRYRMLIEAHTDELAALVTREHGKTLAEAKAEVQRGMEVVEFAAGLPSLLMGETLPQIANSVDCETNRHAVGVCVGITPFNFPIMVPMWMFPIAIGCGNTFILKPSEKVPQAANRLGELLLEAGLPAGVFNIVHGDREVVDALLTHERVRAISFVGSTPIAKYVYETGTRHGKRVQSAGGAKNHLIIMPDADLDQAVSALQMSAYGCAGERCMAGSVALAIGDIGNRMVDSLAGKLEKIKVGPTDGDPTVDMGPVISKQHRDRVAGYLDIATKEGATLSLDGRKRNVDPNGFLIGPSIVDHVEPGMTVYKDEIFGPVLSVVRSKTLEEAIEIGRKCEYGNGASIFTRSGYAARTFKRFFNAGMLGINIGVPAPMAWFPFTGWNKSFFGDLHIQGKESVAFYTQQKMTLTRWFESASESSHDPVWKQSKAGG